MRSKYIYLLLGVDSHIPIAAFTVKKEMYAWLKKRRPALKRIPDERDEVRITEGGRNTYVYLVRMVDGKRGQTILQYEETS